MIKETSLDAYWGLKESRKLNRQQMRILGSMVAGCVYTRLEISKLTGIPINAVCGRVHEMIRMGIMKTNGRVECSVSGRNVEGVVKFGLIEDCRGVSG